MPALGRLWQDCESGQGGAHVMPELGRLWQDSEFEPSTPTSPGYGTKTLYLKKRKKRKKKMYFS